MFKFNLVILYILCLCVLLSNANHCIGTKFTNELTITGWNVRSLSCAKPYMKCLMSVADILVISEHRLYQNELFKLEQINDQFLVHAKSSADLKCEKQSQVIGHCGIAIF